MIRSPGGGRYLRSTPTQNRFTPHTFRSRQMLRPIEFVDHAAIAKPCRSPAWQIPFVTAAIIAVVDWHRLVEVNIPGYLGSLRRW